MDVPLALNDIGIRNGFEGINESPQRFAIGQTLLDFLRLLAYNMFGRELRIWITTNIMMNNLSMVF